jgi:hypothetical protein
LKEAVPNRVPGAVLSATIQIRPLANISYKVKRRRKTIRLFTPPGSIETLL